MKRIFFFLAAAAALASCVKEENTYTPEQDTDRVVTIKAIAADTKTTLGEDGKSILWENGDAIGVVFSTTGGKYLETFSTKLQNSNASADFTATLSEDFVADNNTAAQAYAVYPASSTALANGQVTVKHTLPEEQDGTLKSGHNLSYALINTADVKSGEATADFRNALSLLKLTVPAGVKSVKIATASTANGLVGESVCTVTVSENDVTFVTGGTTKREVTLVNGDELTDGVHYLLVYPGNRSELTLTMTGTDGAVYKKTITRMNASAQEDGIVFEASKTYSINLTKVFQIDVDEVEHVSPMGGTLEIPIAAATDYDYTVTITDNPSWIQVAQNTKAFAGETIVLNVEENNTNATRTAEVTIAWGDGNTRTFTVSQAAVYLDFVYVDPNDTESGLIQWEETFGIFESVDTYNAYVSDTKNNAANLKKTYEDNIFTISLTSGDETQYGTYKVEGMFITDYIFVNGVPKTNFGGVYYADYNAEDSQLTIKMAEAQKSYYFDADVVLSYDATDKKFSLVSPAAFNVNTNSLAYNKDGVIAGYAAVKYVPQDQGGDSSLSAFVGTWSESFSNSYWMGQGDYSNEQTVVVSIDGDKLLFENMFKIVSYGTSYSGSYYGTLSEDGKTITLEDVNTSMGHGAFGPLQYQSSTTIELTVGNGTLTCTSAYSSYLTNYQLSNRTTN